jgi:hypothetical protein
MFEPETERALVAVPLDGTQTELWFKAIQDAYAAQPDGWDSFVDELRITAGQQDSAFDGAFVDAFVVEADRIGDPLAAIEELAKHSVDEIVQEHTEVLRRMTGAAPDSLSWVTDAQQGTLETALGAGWPDLVRAKFDEVWPAWRESGGDDLVRTLDEWTDTIIAEVAASPESSVAGLAWVTDEQQTQLDELYEIRGDWREWLPAELDSRWDQWRETTAEELTPWLDGLLPSLVLPSDDELVEQVRGPAMDAFMADVPALAEELGITVDQLNTEIAELPREFFDEIIRERVAAA